MALTEPRDWVLVTGATGFVGAALVHRLLQSGRRVLCLVRAPSPAAARDRLVQALRMWTRDGQRLLESGRLAALRADLHEADCGLDDAVRRALRDRVPSLVHAAGNTRFCADGAGEPDRTNVAGTRHVLELAERIGCRDWHIISTAYVAGAVREAHEQRGARPPAFHNDYERGKWEAEQLAAAHAQRARATPTIYRPSVVVGHSTSGQSLQFAGIYLLFRAVSLVARAAAQQPGVDRHAIPLRIPARPDGRPNLICIDDVAATFMALYDSPSARGGVYHLTHPAPPSNADIQRALETYYDIGGGRFVGATGAALPGDPQLPGAIPALQRLFDEMTAPLGRYLFDAPHFSRARVVRFVSRRPAPWTDERLRMLIAAAETGGWRANGYARQAAAGPEAFAAYFGRFLPVHLATSRSARVEPLDLTVRFEIGTAACGRWWCRFGGGIVREVAPARHQAAQVIYRTSEARFWAAVAGEITAAELFLAGEAEVDGDVERALKFAMVLERFVQEHPYRRPSHVPCRRTQRHSEPAR